MLLYVYIVVVFSGRILTVLSGHFRFFLSPPQRPMTSDFERFSIPDFILYIFFPILFFRKSQYFPFNVECQIRELLVPFLLRLWYDAVLVGGLNPEPPALEASTLPLRGGGFI